MTNFRTNSDEIKFQKLNEPLNSKGYLYFSFIIKGVEN